MQYTTNYSLSQYDATDRVTRSTFNSDNSKIDTAIKNAANAAAAAASAAAAGCRVVTGSYTGTGTYGQSNPNTLTFSAQPIAVFVCGETNFFLLRGAASAISITAGYNNPLMVLVNWSGTSVSWYSTSNTYHQANVQDRIYHYLALFPIG